MERVDTVVSRLEAAADGRGGVTFLGAAAGEQATDPVEWSRLHDDARAMGAALQTYGARPGSHVALVGPTSRPLVTAIQATWLAGSTVVMLPLPMRLGSVEEFVAQTKARIGHADADLVVVDPELGPFLDAPTGTTVVGLDELAREGARRSPDQLLTAPDDPDRLVILQFTSGSTAEPKGVMLPDRCIRANVDAICEALGTTPMDRAVSWLPLYHDMGLIGLLMTPMLTGFELTLGSPTDFLAAPGVWAEWISAYRGTITAGPNFAYALAGRALRRASNLDLSSWRLALNGAEPVDPSAVEAFCDAAGLHGFDAKAAFPVFGMAEATLAVTFPPVGLGMEVDVVDRVALESERYAAPASPGTRSARRLAVLGRPLRGFELRIVDPDTGRVLREREVGELEMRGPSVTPGYYANPSATEAVFHDGWFRTGDLGYLVDDRLVVCGRLKDVIIVGGRNVFPEDVERAAARVPGVRAGNVIAFGSTGRRGREAVVVAAEIRPEAEVAEVRRGVVHAVRDAVGVPPADVVLVRAGTLPKTSSGKLQRSLCRSRYHADELEPI